MQKTTVKKKRRYRDGHARLISKDLPRILLLPGKEEVCLEVQMSRQFLYGMQNLFSKIVMYIPDEKVYMLEHMAYLAGIMHQVWNETERKKKDRVGIDTSL